MIGAEVLEGDGMANVKKKKGCIGILTGGGDVPGLNPAIRAVTIRALREGYQVIGIRRGWAGLVDMVRDEVRQQRSLSRLTEEIVNRAGRTGGTFLHTSRTNPARGEQEGMFPEHLGSFTDEKNDLTPEVLKNLEWLGIDYMIPIGGDDTLSYGVRLDQEGVKVVAIPKTMDNDVPGTDYCIGFSTCVTRTIQMANSLRTSAGSHERFLVLEVFGTLRGIYRDAADDGRRGESLRDSGVQVQPRAADGIAGGRSAQESEPLRDGAGLGRRDVRRRRHGVRARRDGRVRPQEAGRHRRCGVGPNEAALREIQQRQDDRVITQKLGYLVRCGDPDAIDSIVPMAYGNLALDLILNRIHGRLVVLKNGRYDNTPIDTVTASKKAVSMKENYNTERLRPQYESFEMKPLFLVTSDLG